MALNLTGGDMVTNVLTTLNVIYDGRDPTPKEMSDGLMFLNEALDTWNIDGSKIYAKQFLTFPTDSNYTTTANGIYYTIGAIGSGAYWEMPVGQDVPRNIEFASFQLPTVPVINKPCKVLTDQEWSAIRATQITTNIPNWIYLDRQYPVAHMYVWPIPNGGSTLTFDFWQQLPTTITLTTQLKLPPGYSKAIRLETVMSYASSFNIPIKPEWASQYAEISRLLTGTNIQTNRLEYDVPAGPGVYDVLTDELF